MSSVGAFVPSPPKEIRQATTLISAPSHIWRAITLRYTGRMHIFIHTDQEGQTQLLRIIGGCVVCMRECVYNISVFTHQTELFSAHVLYGAAQQTGMALAPFSSPPAMIIARASPRQVTVMIGANHTRRPLMWRITSAQELICCSPLVYLCVLKPPKMKLFLLCCCCAVRFLCDWWWRSQTATTPIHDRQVLKLAVPDRFLYCIVRLLLFGELRI